MNGGYTFLVLSTVDTPHSSFNRSQRFQQTLETLDSIRTYASGAAIAFMDNSQQPLTPEESSEIYRRVNLWIPYERNLFTAYASGPGHLEWGALKGSNELLMLEVGLPALQRAGLIGRRVFKLSARYKLTRDFNLVEYYPPELDGRYVFKSIEWVFGNSATGVVDTRTWWDTRLWSFCGSLYDHYSGKLPELFAWMLTNKLNLELAHTNCIPPELVLFKQTLWVEGHMAGGDWCFA